MLLYKKENDLTVHERIRLMSLTYLPTADPQVADAINQELSRQRSSIELIASKTSRQSQ